MATVEAMETMAEPRPKTAGVGRPPLAPSERKAKTSVTLPPEVFRAYCRRAQRTGKTLHRVLVETLCASERE